MRSPTRLLFALLLVPAACRSGAADGRSDTRHSGAASTAAAPAEGEICKEHGVLKAICTKCNPKLAAVFQAKGDWCGEHGFPESVCPLCHPERGGRPARDVSAKANAKAKDDAPADGTKVHFKTKDATRLAGILTAKAEARKEGGGVPATLRLAYDATRVAQINARSPGVVRALSVDVGARVKKGDPLAVVESAEVGADRSRLAAARSRLDVAQKSFERQEALQKEGISSTKELLEARRELDAAKAELAVLGSALSVAGAGAGSGGQYTLAAPIAGVVTQRTATLGKRVGVEELLFEVVDTSAVWAEIDVPEADLGVVAEGQDVAIRLDTLPGRALRGIIRYLSPAVDPHTRTARARVPLANPDGQLRANLYGQARILAEARVTVMVPEAAVQRAKAIHLVFVKRAEDEYEAHRVEIGIREGGFVEIIKGIRPGEEVATQGSFLLKTETLKDSIGAGCCDAD